VKAVEGFPLTFMTYGVRLLEYTSAEFVDTSEDNSSGGDVPRERRGSVQKEDLSVRSGSSGREGESK